MLLHLIDSSTYASRVPLCLGSDAKETFRDQVAAWRSGNDVGRINEVTLRRARLVLGWVTVSRFDSRRWAALYFDM